MLLVEGEKGAFDTREFIGFVQELFKIESLDGNERRYCIAGFCLKFVQHAIGTNQSELLRRIIPFVSACLASLIVATKHMLP